MDAETYEPYLMHAQCLVTGLETIECGAEEVLRSPERRSEALAYATSFVQLDEPDDPERFKRIAERVVSYMSDFAADPKNAPFESYRRMRSGVARILREELGLPEIPYYE